MTRRLCQLHDRQHRSQAAGQVHLAQSPLPCGSGAMRTLAPAVARSVLALLLLAGCAQTTVSEQQAYQGPRLARSHEGSAVLARAMCSARTRGKA
jgi:hypothetical protein